MSRTPRKSMAEIRAEEFSAGFEAAMSMVTHTWRQHADPRNPVTMVDLWPLLEKMQSVAGFYDEEFKQHMMPRCFPDSEYERARVRVTVLDGHPHAGRKGFIVDLKSFMKDGMYRVIFLDRKGRADNAYAFPHQIKREIP